jgi:hypothetical protein
MPVVLLLKICFSFLLPLWLHISIVLQSVREAIAMGQAVVTSSYWLPLSSVYFVACVFESVNWLRIVARSKSSRFSTTWAETSVFSKNVHKVFGKISSVKYL